MIITEDGYEPVEVNQSALPCPFCGGAPVLKQVAHTWYLDKKGKSQCVALITSTSRMKGDTFWFVCESCDASTGSHQPTAQMAVEVWNRREVHG